MVSTPKVQAHPEAPLKRLKIKELRAIAAPFFYVQILTCVHLVYTQPLVSAQKISCYMPKSGDKQPNVPIKAHIWQLIAISPVSSLHCCSLEYLYTKTLFNLKNCLEREVRLARQNFADILWTDTQLFSNVVA